MMRFRILRFAGPLFAIAQVAAACGDTGPSEPSAEPVPLEDQSIVFGNFANYTPEGLLEDFSAATGVEVTLSEFGNNEDMLGKLSTAQGTGFDVVMVSGNYIQTLNERGWVAELDHSQIPNTENLAQAATEFAFDPGNVYSVPYTWGTTGLCYRKDLVKTKIDSWDDLLNPAPELQGKVTMLTTERWLLQPALLSLGYSINTENVAEIEEARDLTIQAKPHVLEYNDTTFWEKLNGATPEALMVQGWDGYCNLVEDPSTMEFVVPSEGSDLFADNMVILESSENKEAAHAFINFVLASENHVKVAEFALYKVPDEAAMAMLDPELLATYPNLGISPEEFLAFEEDLPIGEDAQAAWSKAAAEVGAA